MIWSHSYNERRIDLQRIRRESHRRYLLRKRHPPLKHFPWYPGVRSILDTGQRFVVLCVRYCPVYQILQDNRFPWDEVSTRGHRRSFRLTYSSCIYLAQFWIELFLRDIPKFTIRVLRERSNRTTGSFRAFHLSTSGLERTMVRVDAFWLASAD